MQSLELPQGKAAWRHAYGGVLKGSCRIKQEQVQLVENWVESRGTMTSELTEKAEQFCGGVAVKISRLFI